MLLGRGLVVLDHLIDHLEERSELGAGPFDRSLLVTRGLDVPERLLQRVMTDLIVAADLALGTFSTRTFPRISTQTCVLRSTPLPFR